MRNWAGNIQYAAERSISPQTESDLKSLIKNLKGQLRVTGTRHSFSEIADTDGTQLNLEHFRKIEVDKEA